MTIDKILVLRNINLKKRQDMNREPQSIRPSLERPQNWTKDLKTALCFMLGNPVVIWTFAVLTGQSITTDSLLLSLRDAAMEFWSRYRYC